MKKYNIKEIKELPFEEIISLINANEIAEPVKITLPLDVALSEKQFDIAGNFLGVIDASDANTYVDIKFNKFDSEVVRFTKGISFIRPFNRIFFSNAVQAGKNIQLLISAYAPELFQFIDNRSEVIQTTELTNISTYTEDTKKNTRVLNGDTGTQIIKAAELTAAGDAIIHTVTALKTFYLTSLLLEVCTSNIAVTVLIKVRDASDVDQYNLAKIMVAQTSTENNIPLSFPHPIKIPAGYDVVLTINNTAQLAAGKIFGFEE
ncbi:MAG: hypothetical protein V1933_08010 [Candidatus Omnitrophota bacterium]